MTSAFKASLSSCRAAAQAKRLIETHATATLKETAYLLGFAEPASFYRYFKRATGMTAKEYRKSVLRQSSGQ